MVMVGIVVGILFMTGIFGISGHTYSDGNVARSIYLMFNDTREASGLLVRDRTGEYYELTTRFSFNNKTEPAGSADFVFQWNVAEGFDEGAVVFDDPNVAYDVAESEDGWRTITVRCEGLNYGNGLTAKLRYPAEALAVRETAPGYYQWDLDALTEEDVPELNREIASFESLYDCANWIRRNIEYETVSDEPQTAAATFRGKRGDCDDIAVLFCYMAGRLSPETTPRVAEGWTTSGRYHANVLIRTGSGWVTLDPYVSSTQFGVFDIRPFVPSGHVSLPYDVKIAEGGAVEAGAVDGRAAGAGAVEDSAAEPEQLDIAFGEATVERVEP
jgi:hypothetical protein